MSVTWGEIQLITLQKMFSANGSQIPNDASTRDYLAAMPGAANEGLALLATAGKYIEKTINIAHNPPRNLIASGAHIHSIERGSIDFTAERARSYSFDYYGQGTLAIYIDGALAEEITLDPVGGYTCVKGLINNPDDKMVKVVFTSEYPFALKDIALYSANYPDVKDIPPFSEKIKYKLSDYASDFFKLATEDIYYEGDADVTRYIRTTDYFQEGESVLVLDRDTPGNFRVYYYAYPGKITLDTPNEEELAIDNEVYPLLCLYMASQLYKDDDNGIATTYRNEFEVGFERLKVAVSTPSAERFTSESGWI